MSGVIDRLVRILAAVLLAILIVGLAVLIVAVLVTEGLPTPRSQ